MYSTSDNMADSPVPILDLEDPFIHDLVDEIASLERSSSSDSSQSCDLDNTSIFLDQILEQEVPPVESIATGGLTQHNHVVAGRINTLQMLLIEPLDVTESPAAIEQDFFVCSMPEPQGLDSGYNSPVSATRNEKMCDEFRNFYAENSVPDGGQEDSDPQSPRRKRRRYEEEPSANPDHERSRRNAIIAKRNREKKKKLLEELQISVDRLTAKNVQLGNENYQLKGKVAFLEKEMVNLLKSTLLCESSLSSLLLSVQENEQFKFMGEFNRFSRDQRF